MNQYGFVRVAVGSPLVSVANPRANGEATLRLLEEIGANDVVVFPELGITGYTCADLFRQRALLEGAEAAIGRLCGATRSRRQLIVIGAPIRVGNELFNCAVVLFQGRVIGIVPKTHIPNYNEFYESRWFRGADGNEPKEIEYLGTRVPFGVDLLFQCGDLVAFVEICEDLWMPIPPSSHAALAGANLLINLSASNETVAKNEYRNQLIGNQSGRCVAAYAYASAGPTESTTDLVFGGHCLIAENGHILSESPRGGHPDHPVANGDWFTVADIDVQRLQTERALLTSFGESGKTSQRPYRWIDVELHENRWTDLKRTVVAAPFVPKDPATLRNRCAEIFGIQVAGLRKRLSRMSHPNVFLGVSGGLDSTLALLVAVKTYQAAGADVRSIHGLTLPGFGTTSKTKQNALDLMRSLGISQETIDIRAACVQTFNDLRHKPFGASPPHGASAWTVESLTELLGQLTPEQRKKGDLVFENVQARERTKLLMSRGFVIGTGDLSELALGWCTYNGDHMSMYAVNCSIPKTLVRWMVRYVAETECRSDVEGTLDVLGRTTGERDVLYRTLISIADTLISPELLPASKAGEIEQSTEANIGPYELHDFFLSNFVRNGFSPEKILWLSEFAEFSVPYSREQRVRTLRTFLTRFFSQQYKRSCVPDGPKVGSVSLSPRGDWRMPSDADVELWLEGLKG
ncbi:MAG: NAD(+) synthase [Planctomycetaceae bacterium]|nr:NAD(+) synthase [Planctomycetaceae bacterium]